MEFPISQQDLDDWAVPQAYEDFVEFVGVSLWSQMKSSINKDLHWPHYYLNAPLVAENPIIDTSKTVESTYARILDVTIQHMAPNRWPSGRIQALHPPVLQIYKPALIESENKVMEALKKAQAAFIRAQICKKMFSEPLEVSYLPLPEQAEARAGNLIVANHLGLQRNQPWVCIMPTTRKLIMELILPPPGDLGRLGTLPDPATVEETLPAKMLDAMMQDVRQIFGADVVGTAKTPNELLAKLTDDFEEAGVDLSFSLSFDYLAVLKRSAIATSYEITQVLPRYIQQLEDTWRDLRPNYVQIVRELTANGRDRFLPVDRQNDRLLFRANRGVGIVYGSLDRLERSIATNVARRMEHSVAIFESYRANAPLVKALGFSIANRDSSLLLDTPIGIQIMRMSQLFKPVLNKYSKELGSGKLSKFFSEMPRNMPNILTGAGFEVVNLGGLRTINPGVRGEVMDAIEAYFEVDGAVIDIGLQDDYQALAREPKKPIM